MIRDTVSQRITSTSIRDLFTFDGSEQGTNVGLDATPDASQPRIFLVKRTASRAGSGYLPTYGGDCDAQGRVTLLPTEIKTCTVTNSFVGPHRESNSANAVLRSSSASTARGPVPRPAAIFN